MSKNTILIFSGYNMRAVIAFCRFATSHKIPVAIVASHSEDPIYHTSYSEIVVAERSGSQLQVADISELVVKIRSALGVEKLHLLPSSEFLNRFFLANRDHFSQLGVVVPLCDIRLYESLSDKASFCNICSKAGLDVPLELAAETKPAYPFVIKPRTYFGDHGGVQTKPILVFSDEDYDNALKSVDGQEVFYQQYVDGESFYLLYYISKKGEHVSFSQKNLIQQPEGGSIIGAVSSEIHLEPIGEEYRDLLESLGFQGLVMIEIRRSEGRDVMIEANPRLWGPSQLFVDCDVPIFSAFVSDMGYTIKTGTGQQPSYEPRRYFWHGGVPKGEDGHTKLAYHGYSASEFAREYEGWLSSDVYKRPDTYRYYAFETIDPRADAGCSS